MLTLQLDDVVSAAIRAVQQHSLHHLLPYHRARVYAALGDLDTELGYWRHGRLALSTAAYVLPLWRLALPQDGRADELLHLTEQTLLGQEEVTTLDAARDALSSWLEGRGVRPHPRMSGLAGIENDDALEPFGGIEREQQRLAQALPEPAFFAGEAAVAAGIPILGTDVFKGSEISEYDLDGDILESGQDAAWSAANAYAGKFQDPDADKRLSYWMWWLTEAVSQAWSSTPPDGWTRPWIDRR